MVDYQEHMKSWTTHTHIYKYEYKIFAIEMVSS